jgi:hypothetical protein
MPLPIIKGAGTVSPHQQGRSTTLAGRECHARRQDRAGLGGEGGSWAKPADDLIRADGLAGRNKQTRGCEARNVARL